MTAISPILERLSREETLHPLFHYTSLTGLMGIMESKTLFVSEARFLNDASEMKYGAQWLSGECVQRLGLRPGEEGQKVQLLKQFAKWIDERIHNHWGANVFVGCFTLNGDQLSQWRGYCPSGKGVSIGFPGQQLGSAVRAQGFMLARCIYDRDPQTSIAGEVVDIVERLGEERGPNQDRSRRHQDQSFYDIFEEIEEDLLQVCCLFKHPAFKEEDEWRAISRAVRSPNTEEVLYREGASMLIPYLELALPLAFGESVMLETIILGPCPHPELSLASLTSFLGSPRVLTPHLMRPSHIPYRDW